MDPVSLPAARLAAAPHGRHSRGRQYLCRTREEKEKQQRPRGVVVQQQSSVAGDSNAKVRLGLPFLSSSPWVATALPDASLSLLQQEYGYFS